MPVLHTEPGKAQRATFLGQSGSGKTVLMQTNMATMENAVIFDSKHQDWDTPNDFWARGFAQTFGYVVTKNPADIRRFPRVVFQVDTRSLADRTGWSRPGSIGAVWTDALTAVWSRHPGPGTGSTLVVFDEAMHTLPSGGAHPEARRLATQGRAVGLPVWLGTQAPLHVDTVCLAESEHLFSFVQAIPEYRVVIRQRRGVDAELLKDLGRFEFAYNRLGSQEWKEYGALDRPNWAPKEPLGEVNETPAAV